MGLTDNTSIIIVTHNHERYIENCLKSLSYDENLEIIVVDNNSTDSTLQLVESSFPQINLIKNSLNLGFGAANNVGVRYSNREYLVFLNPDTKVENSAIIKLIKPLEADKKRVTTPKILFYNGEKINTCGNKQHITGMAFTRGMGEKPENFNDYRFVNGISGACFASTRKNFLNIGCFDENLFLYMEDTEISWRLNSKGQKILYVPEAIIFHDYDFSVSPEKIYHVERGRYIILRKYLSYKYYFLLAPSLFMTEILTWGYAVLNGPKGISAKLRGFYEGSTMDLMKIESDRKTLLANMNTIIPELEFNFSKIFTVFRKIANFTYKKNRRLL